MGWCGATRIMDTALAAAESVAASVAEDLGAHLDSSKQGALDDHLRPFVATIAEHLRDGDWDCIEESEFFERFPQEMLGYDDREYQRYLHDLVANADPVDWNYNDLVRRLTNINAKLEDSSGTG